MFAKLFTTPHGQLLLTTDFDEDEDMPWLLSARGEDVSGVRATMTFKFETEEERDLSFEAGSQETAEATAGDMHRMLLKFTTA